MKNETFVKLTVVSSKYTPEKITSLIGVACDQSWKIGDLRGRTIIKEKDNGWVLNSGLEKHESLEHHVRGLLKKISPLTEKVRTISTHNYVEFSCAIYSKEIPALHFEKDIIAAINELGASLDIDIYTL